MEEEKKQQAGVNSKGEAPLAAGKKHIVREYAESIIIAIILALIIRTFLVQAFKIPSGSMEDTLAIGDHILVNKFIYGAQIPFTNKRLFSFREPRRGDVIVFVFPKDAENNEIKMWDKKDFIKRIIGTPGDKIQVINKKLYVNNKPYQNPHEVHKDSGIMAPCPAGSMQYDLPSDDQCRRDNFGPIIVPPGVYFCMGDNRDRSYDSRFWGFVKKDYIKGLAFIKYWSWDTTEHNVRWKNIGRLVD